MSPPPTRFTSVASNRWPVSDTSRLSPIPPSTATWVTTPRLIVVTRYSVHALLATMLRPGSTMMRLSLGSKAFAWRHHRVGVVVERGRMLVVGVAHTEAAAEVVDLEGAQRGDGFDRRRQLLDVEQLGADVGMHAVEPHLGAALDPRDRLAGIVGHQAELGARVARRLRGVGGGFDAGDDAHQTRLHVAPRHDALEPVDVVEVVDHDEAHAVLDGQYRVLRRTWRCRAGPAWPDRRPP